MSDTIFRKGFGSPKKLKIQFSVKPLVSSKILKSSSFVFKDNATNNIVYQDLAHGFFINSTSCFEQDDEGYVWIVSTTDGLGLENAGVKVDERGMVETDCSFTNKYF